jgi:hypothetical protein
MDPMNDDRFDDLLEEAARSYHLPPETPREEMWSRIKERTISGGPGAILEEAARSPDPRNQVVETRVHPLPTRWWRRRLFIPLSIAALLALGIGLGRMTVDHMPAGTAARVAPAPSAGPNLAIALAATQHLSRAEAFLTSFRAEHDGARADRRFAGTSRELLLNTRLLLDSPDLQDTHVRALLQDLELILVQIGQLEARPDREERSLIDDGLNQGGLMPRLRTAIPAGPGATRL